MKRKIRNIFHTSNSKTTFSAYFYEWNEQPKKKKIIKEQKTGRIRDVIVTYNS